MFDVDAGMATLAGLWLGEENHDLRIEYDNPTYGDPGYWRLYLSAASDRGNEHHADWVEYTWNFYGESIVEAVEDALDFAQGLKALAPKDEER